VQHRRGARLQVLRHLRQQDRVVRAAAAALLAAASTGLFAPPLAEVARLKPFWLDEGFEIAETCRHPYLSMLARGASGQCSPSPLYYLAQRLSVRSIGRFDEGIAVAYRRVSLVAAGLLLFLVTLALHIRLGPPWALAAAASLVGQPLFVHFAAENRPYMSWLLFFALTVVVAADAASRPWRTVGGRTRIALISSAVALSPIALPGALQAALACLLCGLSWRHQAQDRGEALAALRWSLRLAAACTAVGFYFGARSPCPAYDAGHLALHWPDRAGLVRPVLALIWADGMSGWVGNAFLVLGLVAAVRLSLPPAPLGEERARSERFASSLAIGVAAQLGLTVLLAAQTFGVGYYFLPRVFLYLVVCRALLIAIGGWFLVAWTGKRLPGVARLPLQVLAAALALLAVATASMMERQDLEERRTARPISDAGRCAEVDGPLAIDMPAGSTDWALGPNFIMRLAAEQRRCGAAAGGETRHVLAMPGLGAYRVSAERAPGAVPLEQCGRPVILGR
jgi:hypothetical protein